MYIYIRMRSFRQKIVLKDKKKYLLNGKTFYILKHLGETDNFRRQMTNFFKYHVQKGNIEENDNLFTLTKAKLMNNEFNLHDQTKSDLDYEIQNVNRGLKVISKDFIDYYNSSLDTSSMIKDIKEESNSLTTNLNLNIFHRKSSSLNEDDFIDSICEKYLTENELEEIRSNPEQCKRISSRLQNIKSKPKKKITPTLLNGKVNSNAIKK